MKAVRCVMQALLLGSAIVFAACGGGDGDNDSDSNPSTGQPLTHDQACEVSCEAQSDTDCREALPVAECVDACKSLPETLGGCESEDTALNTCMAEAPLFCDANGYPAVSFDDCGAEIDAFSNCLDGL